MLQKISLPVGILLSICVINLGLSIYSIYILKNENYLLRTKVNELSFQSKEPQKNQAERKENEVTNLVVDNKSLLIANLLFNDTPWTTFTSDNKHVSFSYPENLFTAPQVYGETLSGLAVTVQTYESWKAEAGPNLDGVSDGLGDPDSLENNWEKQFEAYTKAQKDENSMYSFGFELGTVDQTVKIINGIPFLMGVTMGTNGSCDVEYVTYQKNTKIHFRADICDDPIFAKYRKVSDFKNKEVALAAQNILNGIDLDAKTSIKIMAIEEVIKTIEVQ